MDEKRGRLKGVIGGNIILINIDVNVIVGIYEMYVNMRSEYPKCRSFSLPPVQVTLA